MEGDKCSGAMTVFFSILTVLFLSLGCAFAESVRVQGARAKAAAVLDMGIFSVFGEYQRELLEDYEVFGVDAAYGTGEFQREHLESRLDEFMSCNTEPARGIEAAAAGNSLFPISTEGSRVMRTLLLTDEDGWVFRDQVVQNIKAALGTEAAAGFLEAGRKAKELEKAGETYEKQERAAEEGLKKAGQLPGDTGGSTEAVIPVNPALPEKPNNPLELIRKIKKRGILGMVLDDPSSVSQRKVAEKELPSGRKRQEGDLVWKRESGGILEDGIFQEYLFGHFDCVTDEKAEGALAYELEYLLAGKNSDEANLKAVVNKLLLLREGVNFLYLTSDGEMRYAAELLAAAVSGGVPGLTAAVGAALLAAWAYGESLLDVRILLSGGKVPVVKTKNSFRLTLENLGRLLEVLKECKDVEGEGLDYRGYLQMLFLTGQKRSYPIRALDLIEGSLRKKEGMASFQVDHCVAGMEAEAEWTIPMIFAAVPEAFLHVSGEPVIYGTQGKFIYEG